MMFSDVYHAPEEFGLEFVDELHLDDEPYQFDIIAAWRDQSGIIYLAHDSGCSCPSPFEGMSLGDLDTVADWPTKYTELIEFSRKFHRGPKPDELDRFRERIGAS